MINKITYAATMLAAAAFAEQELEVTADARELADAWIAEQDNFAEGRKLQSNFDTEDLAAEGRDDVLICADTGLPGPCKPKPKPKPFPWDFIRMAYCPMRYCSDNYSTCPYGNFWLHEVGEYSPLYIRGWMRNMPPPNSRHGFRINTNRYNGSTCSSTEPTWNPHGEDEGAMNTWPSRAGDLSPITDFNYKA